MGTTRTFTTAGLIFLVVLGTGTSWHVKAVQAAAQPATTQSASQPSLEIDQLIGQLGSDNADDRDAAQNRLVDMGSAANQALELAAEKSADPEIRSRAAAALGQIKDHAANDASLITVHRKDAPVNEVLDEIGRQSHVQFRGFDPGLRNGNVRRTVTLDVDSKPFWDVMSDLCSKLNISPGLDNSARGYMNLYPPAARSWMNGPHQVVGPFWVGITSIYRNRTIDMMGVPVVDDQFSIRMVVYPEPKLAVTQMSDFTIKSARDDAGNSLVPERRANQPFANMRGIHAMNHAVETHLAYPANAGKKIAVLSGEVTVMVSQDVQKYQVDNVLSGAPKVTNPLKDCTIHSTVIRQGEDVFRVEIRCTRAGMNDERWNSIVDRMNDLTVEDAQGNRLAPMMMSMNGQTTESTFEGFAIFSRMTMAFGGNRQAARVGDANKLIWSVATRIKPVKIPVTFKDLPMP